MARVAERFGRRSLALWLLWLAMILALALIGAVGFGAAPPGGAAALG